VAYESPNATGRPVWDAPQGAEGFTGDKAERNREMVRAAMTLDLMPENTFAHDHDLDLMRMYEQRPLTTLYAYAGKYFSSNGLTLTTVQSGAISPHNHLRAVISTAHAMLARSKVRGRFLTQNGRGKQKQRAKEATWWLDGWTEEAGAHELATQALLDALVCRFGVLQLYEDNGKACLQRCLPQEIVFDHVEAIYGKPRRIFRKRAISKATLMAKYGKNERAKVAIAGAPTLEDSNGVISDLVLVWEGWSAATGPGKKDGWHCIGIDREDGDFLTEEYEGTRPGNLYFFFWDKFMVGFGGNSLAAQLETMQEDLNFRAYVERKAMRLFAVPRYGAERGSNIAAEQMTNDIGGRVDYSNNPPVPLVWPYLPPQFFEERDRIIDQMYSIPGISRNASEGVKPAGTESGAAQREAMETQNLRIQIYAQRCWEDPIVELYKGAIEMAADITSDGASYPVEAEVDGETKTIDFKGTVRDLKKYRVRCYPTGFLPLTPAARLDFIKSMLDAKLWDVDRARAALSDLDVEYEESIETSILRMFNKIFEQCIYEGKARRPNELHVGYYDIAIKTGAVYMALAECEDIPEKNVDLAQRYLDELRAMKSKVDAKNAPPTPAPGAPPAPAAPPPAALPAAA
jgi:hypothetical protein